MAAGAPAVIGKICPNGNGPAAVDDQGGRRVLESSHVLPAIEAPSLPSDRRQNRRRIGANGVIHGYQRQAMIDRLRNQDAVERVAV
jgi:hypothetical protein